MPEEKPEEWVEVGQTEWVEVGQTEWVDAVDEFASEEEIQQVEEPEVEEPVSIEEIIDDVIDAVEQPVEEPTEEVVEEQVEDIVEDVVDDEVIEDIIDEIVDNEVIEEAQQQVEESIEDLQEVVEEVVEDVVQDVVEDIQQVEETIEEKVEEIKEEVVEKMKEKVDEAQLSPEEAVTAAHVQFPNLSVKKIASIMKQVPLMLQTLGECESIDLQHLIVFANSEDKNKFANIASVTGFDVDPSDNENELLLSQNLTADAITIVKTILQLAQDGSEYGGSYKGWVVNGKE